MSRIAAFALILLALAAAPASAKLSFDFSQTEYGAVELGADRMTTAPGDEVEIVLRIEPAFGWHTYWLNPGGPGGATTIDWRAPEGVEFSGILWPTPERLEYGPFVNFVHSGETLLVTRMRVPEDWTPGEEIALVASAMWLLCDDICVSETLDFRLTLPTAEEPVVDPEFAALAERAAAARPREIGAVGRYEVDEERIRVFLPAETLETAAVAGGFFFPEPQGVVAAAGAQTVEVSDGEIRIEMRREGEDGLAVRRPLDGALTGVLVVNAADGSSEAVRLAANGPSETDGATPVGGSGADAAGGGAGSGGGSETVETAASGAVSASGGAPSGDLVSATPQSLLAAAIGAFLGGLILNIMPCVFPVLALKAMSFAQGAGRPRRERLTHAGAYAAGVLATFLVIAAALVALKAAGGGERWGFHMQSPWVVGGLAMMMFVIGLNFSGVFEFGARFAGLGSGLAERSGGAGAFFTGVLAVVVASPCTAPFMIGAIGFALTQDAATALVVFAALGLGFAAPLALLGVLPGLSRRLPRPGPWMVRMRQLLAFPMYATAAYLLWVLGGLAGRDAIFAGMIALVLVGAALWATGAGAPSSRLGRRAATAAAVVCALLALGALWAAMRAGDGATRADATDAAERALASAGRAPVAFGAAAISAARAEGRTVFVNVTADWCISCKFNEARVLTSDAVEEALFGGEVLYMVADWTRYDPAITAYLDSYSHPGAPLYVVYRDGGSGVVLPQVLTESVLLEALGAGG